MYLMVFTFFFTTATPSHCFTVLHFPIFRPWTRIPKLVLFCHRKWSASLYCVVFGHIANKFNVILSILKEVIIFLRRVTYFVLAKQIGMSTLRPKYDFFLRRISIWRQKVGSLCWKAGLHDFLSYGNSSKKLVVKYPYLFWQYESGHYIEEK